MEKALALDSYDVKSLSQSRLAAYDALVPGSEFCARLLPSPADMAALRAVFGGRLILATPLLTETGLEAVEDLLKPRAAGKAPVEVIANDLGLLEVLRSDFKGKVRVSCGRILSHCVKIMPEDYGREFLKRYSITGFETDEPHSMKRLARYGLGFSWHYPFRFAAVTRFCPWEERWATRCSYSCRGRMEALMNPHLPKPLWLKGAGYFVRGQGPRKGMRRNVFTPPAGRIGTSNSGIS